MTVFLLILGALAMLAAAAFFAGTETGFLSVSRERILHLAREGGRKAQIVQKALSDMGRTTTTLLIGNNLASVSYSSCTAALSAAFFGSESAGRTVFAFVAAFTVLYVAEFMPKMLCAARPLRRILALAPLYRVAAAALSPLTRIAMRLTDLFIPRRESKYTLTVEDIIRILEDRKDGVCLSDVESALIGRLLVLKRKGAPVTSDTLLSVLRDGLSTEPDGRGGE